MGRFGRVIVAAAMVVSFARLAWAGPVIIDGTDSNDHGDVVLGANIDGWLYMQKALENLAVALDPSVTKVVVNLGASAGDAFDAIHSAFALSPLPGLGWSISDVDGDVAIGTWLDAITTSNTGILYLPTAGTLATGDLSAAELAVINSKALAIDSFVSGAGDPSKGGALFSMAEVASGAYGWLTTLVPGIVVTTHGTGGVDTALTLTADGNTAFPGLTDADLSTGPWHNDFSGSLGGLKVLATGPDDAGVTRNVILGGGAGTVIGCGEPGQRPCPDSAVPEPASLLLFGLGGLGFGFAGRRKRVAP